jgi:hypothetical protein
VSALGRLALLAGLVASLTLSGPGSPGADEPEEVLLERPLEVAGERVTVEITPAGQPLAVGDVVRIFVVAEGHRPGDAITVEARLGSRALTVSAPEVPSGGPGGEPDETGPWLYESEEIEIFSASEENEGREVVAEFRDSTGRATVQGLTRTALLALLEDLLERVGRTADPLPRLGLLEKVAVLLAHARDAALYEYAGRLLQEMAGRSAILAPLQATADDFLGESRAMLNGALRARLDAVAADLIDDAGTAVGTDDVNIRRAGALLKETALAHGVERLIELNRWKVGSGAVPEGTFLAYDESEAMARLRQTRDASELERLLAMNGIADAEPHVRAMRETAARFARQHQGELEAIWHRMEEAREWYAFASRQTELLFDWESSRRLYADRYRRAEGEYRALLQEHGLLKTMVEDAEGKEQPLWQAIGAAASDAQVQAAFDRAVVRAEQEVRAMLGHVVEMRTAADLVALGSPRYQDLHALAAGQGAPLAGSLVGLARGTSQAGTEDSAIESAAWDFGLGVLQVGGILFPPAFYAATAVQVVRRGHDSIVAYGESAEADAAEGAGAGSRLAADHARDHFRRSVGHLVLEGVLGAVDAAAIRALRAAEGAEAGALTLARLKEIGDQLKAEWAAQRRFQLEITKLQGSIDRAERMAAGKRAAIAEWDRKIRDALADGNAALRDARMAKRATDHRILVDHWLRLARSKRQELRALKERGPAVPDQWAEARQGADVERAAARFWERLADNPAVTLVERIGDRRFQLGERIEGTVNGIGRRRYEVRLNERIVDAEGRAIRPPETVLLPGETVPVKNPHAGEASMRFDRIVIDHVEGVIHLEDLVRTGRRSHLIKTHSYASGLEQMFPGYRVRGVERDHAGTWPRDVVWGSMESPISAVSADLRRYTVHKGESREGPGH